MGKDWSGGAWNDVLFDMVRVPQPGDAGEPMSLRLQRFGLPGLCLLVGLMAAVVYAWPTLFLAHMLFDLSGVVFWSAFIGVGAVAAVAAFAVTHWERGHWDRKRHGISDWVDPEP